MIGQLLQPQTLRFLRGINSLTQLNGGPHIQYQMLEKVNNELNLVLLNWFFIGKY